MKHSQSLPAALCCQLPSDHTSDLQPPNGLAWSDFSRLLIGGLCRRGVPRHKAEDLAQEAVLRLLTRSCRPKEPERWLAWARAVALNLLRSELRRPPTSALEDAEELPESGRCDTDPLVTTEAWAWLVARVAALPARQGQAFCLRRLQDRTPSDASRSLGCTPEQLKRVLHRAMSRLRLEAEAAGWRSSEDAAPRRAA